MFVKRHDTICVSELRISSKILIICPSLIVIGKCMICFVYLGKDMSSFWIPVCVKSFAEGKKILPYIRTRCIFWYIKKIVIIHLFTRNTKKIHTLFNIINKYLRKPFVYLPRKKTCDMVDNYSTDSATVSALISLNKQSSQQLTITFNGMSYVVPHTTMCICSTLVKEMTSDTEGLVEPIELSCDHVSNA